MIASRIIEILATEFPERNTKRDARIIKLVQQALREEREARAHVAP